MRWMAIAGAAVGVALATAAPAVASTVSADGGGISFTADPGEANQLTVHLSGQYASVSDPGSTITPLAQCVQGDDDHSVTCDTATPTDNHVAVVDLGDRDDTVNFADDGSWHSRVDGGEGNDTIVTGHGVFRQSGTTADGGPGNDAILTDAYAQIDGGAGNDLVVGVAPSFGTRLAGGDGDDRIFSLGAPHYIDGGAGRDTVALPPPPWDVGTCGPDEDVATYVSLDPGLLDCETVVPLGYLPYASVAAAAAGQRVPDDAQLWPPDERSAVTTQVTTPNAGGVTIERLGVPAGADEIPLTVRVSAPPTTAAAPLTITMRIDDAVAPPGSGVTLRRDGVDVPACDSPATPDPCISGRTNVDGDSLLTVRASRGGAFTFAIPGAPPPPTYPEWHILAPGEVDQYLPGSAPGQSSSAPPSSQSTATPHAVLGAVKFPSLKTVIARGVRVRLTCAAKCRTTVQLRLASRTARRMHLQVVVGSKTVSFEGRRTIYVKPTHKSAKKLRKVRSAKLAVKML